ncbi:tripartite tricarboxylate transporter permease [Nocardioides sp. LHG3406-4]|uniref:tripartite tricarboxylate transporter permease n=1 Tax=Nocardioides sp. LHG3406-4 TaxID=2804575 RepID=UPI003CF974C5
MLEGILPGLMDALSFDVLFWVAVGAVFGSIVAAVPGLGGPFAVAMLFPLAVTLDPLPAIAMIITATAVSGTANTITGVMFNVPGSGSGVAVMFDGYPMAQRGEADRAIAAGLFSSLAGGVVGAVLLAVSLPVAMLAVQSFGPAEFVALIVIALLMINTVQEGSQLKALIAAAIGMALAFVGQAPDSGELRFTFDTLYLWDGVALVPMVIGLYAISEMLELAGRGGTIAHKASDEFLEARKSRQGGLRRGARDVVENWKVCLMSSVIGVAVGFLPGLGGGAAQFAGYGLAAKVGSDRHNYGKGSPQGVVAADATNNASDGGALIPTLAFGIPGSTSMALVLALLIREGYNPGRTMIENNSDLLWMIVAVLVIGNVMAVAVSLGLVRLIRGLTFAPVAYIVPTVLAVSLWGAFATKQSVGDIAVALIFGVVGLVFKKWGFSRASLVIAFVLAPLLERHLLLSTKLYGWDFVFRPIVVSMVVILAVSIAASKAFRVWTERRAQRRGVDTPATHDVSP